MLRASLFAISLLLSIACHPAPATSPPVAAKRPRPSSASIESLSRSTHYRYAADGTYTRTERHRYRLRDAAAVRESAVLYVGWDTWAEATPTLTATITRPDGTRRELDTKTIHHESDGDFNYLIAELEDLVVGAEVEQVITHKSAATPPYADVRTEWLRDDQPCAVRELIIEAPASSRIHHAVLGTAARAAEQTKDGTRRITWTATDVPAADPDPDTGVPGDRPDIPRLVFRAHTLTWRDVARTYAEEVDAALTRLTIPPAAKTILDKKSPRDATIADLLAWYGDAADSYTLPDLPTSPALVHGASDIGQAVLLVGLLRAAGIPAHVALLRADPEPDLTPGFPGLGETDHAIVHIPGSDPRWIDPAALRPRAGPLLPHGRLALIAAADTEAPVHLPRARAGEHSYAATRTILLPEFGRARVREQVTATGAYDRDLRVLRSGTPEQQQKRLAWYAEAEHSGRLGPTNPTTTASDLDITLENVATAETALDEASAVLGTGDLWTLLADPLRSPEARPRRHPLVVTPFEARITHVVPVPTGFTAPLPTFTTYDLAPLTLERTATRDGDDIVVTTRVRLAVDRLTPAQVDRIRRELARYNDEPATAIELRHRAAVARDSGDLREAQRILTAEARTGGAVTRLRLANFLNRLHLRDRSLAEVRTVLAAQPNHALAHGMLADLLRDDSVGRERRRGWDRRGSIAASRRAAALDPNLVRDALIPAAIDAQTGDLGELYVHGADLDLAAELWASVPADALVDLPDSAEQELRLLWHLGRHDAIQARVAEYGPRAPLLGAWMITWHKSGMPGVLERLADPDLAPADRAWNLSIAFFLLLRHATPAELAALFDAAATLGIADEPQFRTMHSLHRAAVRADAVVAAATGPQQLVVRLADAMLEPDLDAGRRRIDALVSTRVHTRSHVMNSLRFWLDPRRRTMTPEARKFTRDSMLGTLTITAEGSDLTGHRITLTAEDSRPDHLYVVRDGPDYKVRATDRNGSELVREAAARFDAGDPVAGRQWLAWHYERARRTTAPDLRQQPELLLWFDGADPALVARVALAMDGDPAARKAVQTARAKRRPADPIAVHLDHAIARMADDDPRAALKAVKNLRVRYPNADDLTLIDMWIATARRDWPQADRDAEAYLHAHPNSPHILRAWAHNLADRGEHTRAIEKLADIQTHADLTDNDLNLLAWWSLFTPSSTPDPRALPWARHAAASDNTARIHTLGCVEAAVGHISDALTTYDRLQQLHEEPDLADAYLLAEIHRQLGYTSEATAGYTRVAAATATDPDTAALAKRRLTTTKR